MCLPRGANSVRRRYWCPRGHEGYRTTWIHVAVHNAIARALPLLVVCLPTTAGRCPHAAARASLRRSGAARLASSASRSRCVIGTLVAGASCLLSLFGRRGERLAAVAREERQQLARERQRWWAGAGAERSRESGEREQLGVSKKQSKQRGGD
ncbi:hypothetical protein Scep_019245 [Stephania cephalantha]|uniref:Uncharacterized protein n=1 Tax=Stephania cephalantha TaxID=152367 RepID=A0AAP0IAB9_9MAGN